MTLSQTFWHSCFLYRNYRYKCVDTYITHIFHPIHFECSTPNRDRSRAGSFNTNSNNYPLIRDNVWALYSNREKWWLNSRGWASSSLLSLHSHEHGCHMYYYSGTFHFHIRYLTAGFTNSNVLITAIHSVFLFKWLSKRIRLMVASTWVIRLWT